MSLNAQDRETLRREFLQRAEGSFAAMFGEEEQEQLITFTQRESRAIREGKKLEAWLLEQHVTADPLADPELAQATQCPRCRRQGLPDEEDQTPVPRQLTSRIGGHEFARRKYRCPSCETVFFPLGRAAAARPGEPQSGSGPEGRPARR